MDISLDLLPQDVLATISHMLYSSGDNSNNIRICCKSTYMAIPHYLSTLRKTHVLARLYVEWERSYGKTPSLPFEYRVTRLRPPLRDSTSCPLVLVNSLDILGYLLLDNVGHSRYCDLYEIPQAPVGDCYEDLVAANTVYTRSNGVDDLLRCRQAVGDYSPHIAINIITNGSPSGMFRFAMMRTGSSQRLSIARDPQHLRFRAVCSWLPLHHYIGSSAREMW